MHRTTGKVTQAAPAEIERNRSDASLVEVETISEHAQLQWLRDFLKSKGRPDHDEENLRVLLRGRNGFDPPTARDWKYFRARKAVEHVKQWAVRNGLPEAMVLQPANREIKPKRVPAAHHVAVADDALRAATIAAISEMSLEELGKLWVPLEHIYRYFAPK